jgi:outer membrane protein TolC
MIESVNPLDQQTLGGHMRLFMTSLLTLLTIGCQVSAAEDFAVQATGKASHEVLTLERAIELASRQNSTLRNAELDIFRAEEHLAAIRTRRLPSFHLLTSVAQQLTPIDFIFQPGAFGSFPLIGPVPASETNLGTPAKTTGLILGRIDQPLSQIYRINLRAEQIKLNGKLATEELRRRKQEVVQDVTRTYFAILQTQSALHNSAQSLVLYRELARVTQEHVLQKTALEFENLDLKVKVAEAEYEWLLLSDRLASEKMQLNKLIGCPVSTEFDVSPIPEDSVYEADLAGIRGRALEQRPELRKARIAVQQALANHKLKKSDFIPEVTLNFQYLSLQNFRDFLPKHASSVGITATWEVFDWGRKRRELNELELALEQARNDVKEMEASMLIEIDDKSRKLQQARQRLTIARLAQEAAQEHVRVMTNRYRLQVSLLKDVLQAQSSMEEANSQYQQSLSSFWTARAEFAKAAGETP